jgi:hypothetical protein
MIIEGSGSRRPKNIRIRIRIRIATLASRHIKISFFEAVLGIRVRISSKSKVGNKQKFLVGVLKVWDKNSRSRMRIHWSEAWTRGSAYPYQSVTDPQHCFEVQ